jgi:hypothetical protein
MHLKIRAFYLVKNNDFMKSSIINFILNIINLYLPELGILPFGPQLSISLFGQRHVGNVDGK